MGQGITLGPPQIGKCVRLNKEESAHSSSVASSSVASSSVASSSVASSNVASSSVASSNVDLSNHEVPVFTARILPRDLSETVTNTKSKYDFRKWC